MASSVIAIEQFLHRNTNFTYFCINGETLVRFEGDYKEKKALFGCIFVDSEFEGLVPFRVGSTISIDNGLEVL